VETIEDKISRYGKSFIIDLSMLIRAAGIYDSMNETIISMAQRLLDELEIFLEESGEIAIKIIEGSFYIEGMRIKAGVSDIDVFTSLAREFKKRSIGSFDFKAPVKIEDLIQLAYAIKEGGESSEIQTALDKNLTKGITIGGPVSMQKEERIDLKDGYAVARRAYLKSLLSVRELYTFLKAGKRVQLKKIKRALQLIVDSILTDETYLTGFITGRDVADYSYFHPVHVSIYSVLLGKEIGFNRQFLRTLAITALFHDVGKIEIPPSLLNKMTDFTPKEQELIKRHPVDGINIILKSFGLSEAQILSMLVSYEHHMKFDLSGYPADSDRRRLSLFSRIVSIADDYDSLVSGKVYERRKIGKRDALKLMIEGSGTLYDPILIKAFIGIFSSGNARSTVSVP
jgi:HD-GYP domain-containing protein (c-di-GMP phosphodiesterase class II)